MRLLIVEDEPDLRESIAEYLFEEGFDCEGVPNMELARRKLAAAAFDAIVLDLNLPDGNGLKLLDDLKSFYPESGVLILSARDALDDRLQGLENGADDYLTKPFHLSELNARLSAIIRRKQFGGRMKVTYNEIEIEPENRQVTINGQIIELTRREYDLLLYLLVNRNRVVTREAIAEHLWGDHVDVADSLDFIYTHIKNLRRKIRDVGGEDYFQSVYGIGYRLCDR